MFCDCLMLYHHAMSCHHHIIMLCSCDIIMTCHIICHVRIFYFIGWGRNGNRRKRRRFDKRTRTKNCHCQSRISGVRFEKSYSWPRSVCHVTSLVVNSCHVISCHVISSRIMLCHVTSSHVMSRHVLLRMRIYTSLTIL